MPRARNSWKLPRANALRGKICRAQTTPISLTSELSCLPRDNFSCRVPDCGNLLMLSATGPSVTCAFRQRWLGKRLKTTSTWNRYKRDDNYEIRAFNCKHYLQVSSQAQTWVWGPHVEEWFFANVPFDKHEEWQNFLVSDSSIIVELVPSNVITLLFFSKKISSFLVYLFSHKYTFSVQQYQT